jgi:transposase
MDKDIRHVGFDVDTEKIAVAVAEPGGEVRSLGIIPSREDAVRRLVKKLGPASRLRICYEAGPHGYSLYWQLSELGVHCDVVAPTLVPVKSGDRVKTNRRDAEKLARCYRSGDLTAVWVPDAGHEALRDLVRAREAATKDQLRARHRLGKFLLRRGLRGGRREELDGEAPPVGEDAALRARGPGGRLPRLSARGGARGAEGGAAGSSD